MQYRSDIDGLRAIAVLSVIFFHLGAPVVPGGFIGVDIFFVISGYLITLILLSELSDGNFSFSSFYLRRVRRIIPMLYTVCTVSAFAAVWFFLPSDLIGFGKSLSATVLFGSNIFFLNDASYFTAPVLTKPLLHTWSLAVEEQFYIFFPLLLFVIAKYFKKIPPSLFIVTALFSLFYAVLETYDNMDAAFYLAHLRAWEFLIGSILAANFLPKLRAVTAQISGGLGILLIVLGLTLLNEDVRFPGFSALLPCLGAFLLIYAGQTGSLVGKVLSLPVMVYVGKRSYSLYLWHWPLIVFASYQSPGNLTLFQNIFLLMSMFVLSEVSYHYIEQPCRKGGFFQEKRKAFYATAVLSVLLIFISSVFILSKGMPVRFNDIEMLASWKSDHVLDACVDIDPEKFFQKNCKFGDLQQNTDTFLIWGDSHAYAMAPGIYAAAETLHKRGTLSSNSGCPPVVTVLNLSRKCRAANDAVLSFIQPGMHVFLVARWTYYQDKSPINREGPSLLKDKDSRILGVDESRLVLERGLRETIRVLQDKGAIPVIVGSGPEFYRDVADAAFVTRQDIKVDRKLVETRNLFSEKLLSSLSEDFDIPYVRIVPELCGMDACYGYRDGQLYFFDNDHLNTKGAELLYPVFLRSFASN